MTQNNIDKDALLAKTVCIVEKAGALVLGMREMPLGTKHKQGLDIVTNADLAAQEFLRKELLALLPDSVIVSEEMVKGNESGSSLPRWIVDPVDGTVNYASGLPFFGVSVACKIRETVLVSAVNFPALKASLSYCDGRTGLLNGKQITVSQTRKLADAVVSIVITSHFSEAVFLRAEKLLHKFIRATRGVRIIVCGAYEGTLVAAGQIDAFISVKNDIFSLAGCIPAVRAAGGRVMNFRGEDVDESSEELLVSNGFLHKEILDLINE